MCEEQVLRKRAAVERWKVQNRERYLKQKRELSSRPEYKAHRRELYHAKRQALIAAGFAPKKQGRPRLYTVEEAAERKRQRAREYAKRIRSARNAHISQLKEMSLKKQVKIDIDFAIDANIEPIAPRNGIGLILQNNRRFRHLMDARGLTPAGK